MKTIKAVTLAVILMSLVTSCTKEPMPRKDDGGSILSPKPPQPPAYMRQD